MTARVRYELGRFRLDPGARRLETVDGEPVVTTAKAFDALVYFVEHPGVAIPRRKLIEALWPDRVVDENGLSQAISALRRALGDGYVVTVPGRGYQFIAEVRTARPMEPSEDSAAAALPDARRKRLAWRNAAILTVGIAAAAALALVLWLQLTVGERGSNSPPAITVIAPSMPAGGSPEPYPRDGSPGVAGGTEDVRAWEHYDAAQQLRRQGFDPDALRRAAAKFEQALDLDENFGLAQVGLAQTFGALAVLSTKPDDVAEFAAKHARAVDRAIELAPELPAALELLAQRQVRARQWQDAEVTLKKWVAISEENDYGAILSYGVFLSNVGRSRDASQYLEQALGMNPAHAEPYVLLSMARDALGESERAVDLNRSARDRVGYGIMSWAPQFWRMLAVDDIDIDGVRRAFVDAQIAFNGADPEIEKYLRSEDLPPGLDAFGRLVVGSVQRLHDREGGREYLRAELEDPDLQTAPGMFNLALFAAYFDDANLSIDALRRMPSSDLAAVPHALLWIPLMHTVRRHPEFAAFMRELGLSAYWRESGWPEHCRPLGDDDLECS